MGRHSGWVSVGQWRGLASWVGFHVLARWATSCLTRIWVSKSLWSYLCSPDLLFEGDAKGREGFACAFMRVWVASFFSWKNGGRLCIVKCRTSALKPPPFGLCCCTQIPVQQGRGQAGRCAKTHFPCLFSLFLGVCWGMGFRRLQQASSTQTMTSVFPIICDPFFASTADFECLAWGVKLIADCMPRSNWCSRIRIRNIMSLRSQLTS